MADNLDHPDYPPAFQSLKLRHLQYSNRSGELARIVVLLLGHALAGVQQEIPTVFA